MLSNKYLWCLTQDYDLYSDVLKWDEAIEDKEIGIHCTIFQEANDPTETVYIMFRGTELKWNDIIVDLLFFKKNVRKKKVNQMGRSLQCHWGFYNAVYSIYAKIVAFLKSKDLLNNKIVIFGHSAGAAEAKEFTRRFLSNEAAVCIYDIKVITFGTPRTGNKWYANWFDDIDMVEYLTRGDIIGKLPPEFCNYRHTTHIKMIGKRCTGHHGYGRFL